MRADTGLSGSKDKMGDRQKTTRNCLDPWEYVEFRPGWTISPCCAQHAFCEPIQTDLYQFRNNAAFRMLRQSLLEGELGLKCRTCSHREMVTVDAFRERLKAAHPELSDPLAPAERIQMIRIDMTERCNLRCTYCAASQPDYRGIVVDKGDGVEGGRRMDEEELDRIIREIRRYPYPIAEIAVNGHGETTCYPGWHEVCNRLLEDGHHLTITSNFAKVFDRDEISTLARFKAITISIDTSDPELLEAIRRKVDLGTILSNLFRIRTRALADGQTTPRIAFHAGIYDRNLPTLIHFAWFSVACQVDAVIFWKLAKYPDVPKAQNVYPIHFLDRKAFAEALATIDKTRRILMENGIDAVFPPDFENDLRQSVEKRVLLNLRHAQRFGDDLTVSASIQVATPDPARTIYLYVALGGDNPIRLLDDRGRFHEWAGDVIAPAHRAIRRVDQEIEFSVPIKGVDDASDLIVGCGEDIADVISEAAYVRVPYPPEAPRKSAI